MIQLRQSVVCLLMSAAGCLPFAVGGPVPVSYTAPTDQSIRPKPPLPDIGRAGTIFTDPTFGSRILRVTDAETQPNAVGTPFRGPAESFMNNWNADGTLFWIYGKGGVLPFRFDAATMTATRVAKAGDASGGLILPIVGPFSRQRPSVLYGGKGLEIVEYDFNADRYTPVFDARTAVAGASGPAEAPSVSDDDGRLSLAFGGAADGYQYVAVLDRATGSYKVLDARNSTVEGRPTTVPLGSAIRSAHLDRSGRYVVIAKSGNPPSSAVVVWDVDAGTVAEIGATGSGGVASGFGMSVSSAGMQPVLRSLDSSRIDNGRQLLSFSEAPTPNQSAGDLSWNNARAEALVPVFSSQYRDMRDTAQPWRVWDDEIIAAATDGSGKVWRFAHHRSLYDGTNFWDTPRGNVSPDGRMLLFTSNWERTLGQDPAGSGFRQDVFIVELAAQAAQAAGTAPTAALASAPAQKPGDSLAMVAAVTRPGARYTTSAVAASTYSSPYCGPSGGSTTWACKAWPSTTPPTIGGVGSIASDPDTHNRVMRVTQSGSFGEAASSSFKTYDGGWKNAWNADNTRILVWTWSGGLVKFAAHWVGFDPTTMKLTGTGTNVPSQFVDEEWDQTNPDLIVGLASGAAATYNVVTKVQTQVFNPGSVNWGGTPWIASWGGNRVCMASGPQDLGYRLACHDRQTGASQAIDLRANTINGAKFTVYLNGKAITIPSGVTIHTITMAPDGKWLAVDTHGNTLCSIGTVKNYASTSLFIDLQTNTGYEWNVACGGTHWAYGFNSVMMQSTSAKWTGTNGPNGPCNSDSRGVAKRTTDSATDSSLIITEPCLFFNPATWSVSVHLSWTNNSNSANANNPPVMMATSNEGVSNSFLWSDIAGVESATPQFQGRLWRFAQHWNDKATAQCGFMSYSSPSISRDGRYALYPSDWRGQTGSNGNCTNKRRTDVFVFELK